MTDAWRARNSTIPLGAGRKHLCRRDEDSAWGLTPGTGLKTRPPPIRGGRTGAWGVAVLTKWTADHKYLRPLQHLQPATRVQFGLGAILPRSNTPSLRVAGFEDDDEDEYEAPRDAWSRLANITMIFPTLIGF